MRLQSIFIAATVVGVIFASCKDRDNSTSTTAESHAVMRADPMGPLPDDYENRSAQEKLDILWDKHIVRTKFEGDLSKMAALQSPNWESAISLFTPDFLRPTFTNVGDEMPKARKKMIHARGVVGKVEFIPTKNSDAVQYTGLFATGSKFALARLSMATGDNCAPGMALKFLADKVPSVNIMVMHSVNGQEKGCKFFHNIDGVLSNTIPHPGGVLLTQLGEAFAKVKKDPSHLPIDHLATYDQDGSFVAKNMVRAPHTIVFVPYHEVRSSLYQGLGDIKQFREDLLELHAPQELYSVYAINKPTTSDDIAVIEKKLARVPELAEPHEKGETRIGKFRFEWQRVGTLVLRSPFVASQWGDEKLFFRHQDEE